MKQKIIIALILIISPFLWINFQQKIDAKIGEDKKIENLVYIPSGKFLSLMTLGYRDVVANFLWMKTSIYFGEHFQTDKNFTWIYRLVDSITDLDPSFYYPYLFGALTLSDEIGDTEKSNEVLYKGWTHIPNNWNFPFYLGYNAFFYDKDFQKAAKFIKAASELEGSPPYLKAMYVELLYKGNSPLVSEAFLTQSLEHIGSDEAREQLLKKIEAYRNNGK